MASPSKEHFCGIIQDTPRNVRGLLHAVPNSSEDSCLAIAFACVCGCLHNLVAILAQFVLVHAFPLEWLAPIRPVKKEPQKCW